MAANRLKLNSEKSEVIWVGPKRTATQHAWPPIKIGTSSIINDYFSTVGKKLLEDLQHNNAGFDFCNFKQYCDRPVMDSMFVQTADVSKLLKLITGLKNGKAPGYDQIGPSLVREISSVICEPLLHVFNLSLNSGIVPS